MMIKTWENTWNLEGAQFSAASLVLIYYKHIAVIKMNWMGMHE